MLYNSTKNNNNNNKINNNKMNKTNVIFPNKYIISNDLQTSLDYSELVIDGIAVEQPSNIQ